MIPIPAEYTKGNFLYKLVMREPKAAIYSQTHKSSGNVCAYEACRIGRQKEKKAFGGVTFRAKETLPTTEQWGTLGWTFFTLDAAKAKFREIVDSTRSRAGKRAGSGAD